METKKLHFMGVAGAGISAVAVFAQSAGFEISGCDIDPNSPFLKELENAGIKVEKSHSPSHLEGVETLVVTPAIESLDPDNSELKLAREKGIEILTGEEFLAKNILPNKKVIAVTGTHGKSTTTAMVGWILEKAGLDPSVLVGAVVNDWKVNFRQGKSDYFVLEADEYQEKFLLYHPEIAVVTAVEMDHPEYFKDEGQVREAFQKFVLNIKDGGSLVVGPNVHFPNVKVPVKEFHKEDFNLRLIGDFNQDNALCALHVAEILGIETDVAKKALESFNGVGRRFEFKGEEKGVTVFEDYAHHPTAIKVTTAAIRAKFPDTPIWVVYQPHMFSRTKYLFDEFVKVFKSLPVENIILVDIFAARQENTENISSLDIVNAARQDNIKYVGDFEKTANYIVTHASVGDIVVVMGAGDIYKLSQILLNQLRK